MAHDTGERSGTETFLLGQLERAEARAEAERRRSDYLLTSYGSVLVHIDRRLMAIEAGLSAARTPLNGHLSGLTLSQWLKIAAGLALPLAALLLALMGQGDAARKLLAP